MYNLNLFVFLFNLVVDFFNRINLIYGVIAEVCIDESCFIMFGGKRFV